MALLNPYLHFVGTTEKAFNFYKSIFGGEFQSFSRFKDAPPNPQLTPADMERVLHVALPVGANMLMGSDCPENMKNDIKVGNNITVSVMVDSKAEVDRVFNALAKGGKVVMPVADMFWGDYFGRCVDQFGVPWMVSYHKSQFVISRTFKAPLQRLWEAWTKQEDMSQWFGPKGSKATYHRHELKVGGITHYSLIHPDGIEIWGKCEYKEIVPMKKLVFTQCFSDKDLGVTRHPMSTTWPLTMLTTVTFSEHDGQSNVTIIWETVGATSEEQKTFDSSMEDMKQGWGGSLDQLEVYLKRS